MPSSSNVAGARQPLGQRLREIRKDAGLTAQALAGLAGWHESKCSRIEHGRTSPSDADIRIDGQSCCDLVGHPLLSVAAQCPTTTASTSTLLCAGGGVACRIACRSHLTAAVNLVHHRWWERVRAASR
ncbi:helix-turn-helix domain-containing protein [Streptomyces sp. CA-250714]|uniref:helix-turn-helix domain-containing protein n=1 Tax=Streptomyces sp. CA-250714 TaxID=3240060 RepID=UPI003D8E0495